MKVYGDIERVNLATGERFRRVTGDGESRLVSTSESPLKDRARQLEQRADDRDVRDIWLGPRPESYEETSRRARELADQIIKRLKEKQMVRAKFTLSAHRSMLTTRTVDKTKPYNAPGNQEQVELRTLEFSPVYANNDPNHENSKFWDASPSGKIELGTINPRAWEAFELGKEYYIDFTPAS